MSFALRNKYIHVLLTIVLAGFVFVCLPTAHTNAQQGIGTSAAFSDGRTLTQPEGVNNESVVPSSSTNGAGPAKTKLEQALGTFKWLIYQFFTGIGAIVLWFGGFLLDETLKLLVVDMAGAINSFGVGPAIDSLWKVIRDMFNLAFIFGLIFIGFKIILGIDDSQAKRTLGTLLAAALLINFSLYVTKAVVDFSNLAAYEIYDLIEISGSYTNSSGDEVKGIAGRFVAMTDLESYSDSAANSLVELADSSLGTFKILGFALIVMIFMMITGFTFIAGAVVMITRFIALILLMIFSPIMFLGWVLPNFKSFSSDWWKKFLNYCFVAPAYIFMIYLGLFTLKNMEFEGSSFGEAYSGNPGLFGFFLYYLIVTGFIYAALLVAQKMGAAGAAQMHSMGKSIGNSARKTVTSASKAVASSAGRNSVGRLGDRFVKGFDKWDAKDSASARFLRSTGLDRNVRAMGESAKNAKFGGSQSRADVKKYNDERSAKLARIRSIDKLTQAAGEKGMSAEQAFADASTAQVLELADGDKGRNLLVNNAENLTSEQIKKILDSDKIDDEFKSKLGTAVSKATLTKVTTKDRKISDASKNQLQAIGYEQLKDTALAVALTSKQIEHIESVFTETQVNEIKRIRKEAIEKIAKGAVEEIGEINKKTLLGYKPEEMSKLPADALVALAPELPIATLKKIAENSKKEDQQKIRTEIEKDSDKYSRPAKGLKPGADGYTTAHEMWEFLNNDAIGRKLGR